jgi:hypothetical protein
VSFNLQFDRDALIKAAVMAAFAGAVAALQVIESAIPGLKLDPIVQVFLLGATTALIAAVSKAKPVE